MPQSNHIKSVLLFTGHLIDHAERLEKRFPPDALDTMRNLIRAYIREEMRLNPPDMAVCSLAAGGDMIFAGEVLEMGIPLTVFLPFEKERFLEESVIYDKGNQDDSPEFWENEFERILSLAEDVRYPSNIPDDVNPFEQCNSSMLDYAEEISGNEPGSISAIALLRLKEEKIKGGTSHFVDELNKRDIPLQILWPAEKDTSGEVKHLSSLIPLFGYLDSSASSYQSKWKNRLKVSIVILAVIAFSDAFVSSPDNLFWGYGNIVRPLALIISLAGVFITLQLQISDKTSLRQWTENRAKAEQIRSEIWFYLFNLWNRNNRSGTYGESEFEAYIRNLTPHTWHGNVIKLTKLNQLKQLALKFPVSGKINYYSTYRLNDQLSYFRKKHTYFGNRLRLYKTATYLFLIISVTWGSYMLVSEFYTLPMFFADISPLGMMISFIALVSTYAESNNSKEMEYKYQQMAEGLKAFKDKFSDIQTHEQFGSLVKECESFLRTQNNEWSLKRLNN